MVVSANHNCWAVDNIGGSEFSMHARAPDYLFQLVVHSQNLVAQYFAVNSHSYCEVIFLLHFAVVYMICHNRVYTNALKAEIMCNILFKYNLSVEQALSAKCKQYYLTSA